jgi:hypothetical protein
MLLRSVPPSQTKVATMRVFSLLSLLLFLLAGVDGYSVYDPNQLSQKSVVARSSVMAMRTVREPLRMPSQTPMVPYKVGFLFWMREILLHL